jgi:hypothetical protein
MWLKEAVVSYLDGHEEYFELKEELKRLPQGKGQNRFQQATAIREHTLQALGWR